MDKKSVAASILVIALAITFSVVGICFSYFVFTDTKIEVEKVSVVYTEGIEIFSDKELKTKVTELSLSKMDGGIKPATGEVDSETQIPSTITDTGSSEGYYSTVFLKTSSNYKIVLKNIKVESKKHKLEVKEERKNIFVSFKDITNSTKSLEEDEIEIASFSNVTETQELTFFIWLGSLAGENLEGAKISFTLDFILI